MLTRSIPTSNPAKQQQLNQYFNNYNCYTKSTIKLAQMKKRLFHKLQMQSHEYKSKNQLPKMLYSSSMTTQNNSSIDHNHLLPQTSDGHANRPLLFNALFDCADDIGIHMDSEANPDIINDLEDEKTFITKPNRTLKGQEPLVKVTTEITESSVAQNIKEARRNHKNILQFNNYGKYKYSEQGLNFPKGTDKDNLPIFDGDNSRECNYFNYRKEINNPKIVYTPIGSFNNKFNKELARISHSYGTEKAKGHFIPNPLIDSYLNLIPLYDIYRDVKFVENRYIDKKSKFKLLPLINAKMRNIDRLGTKIYRSMKQKKLGL